MAHAAKADTCHPSSVSSFQWSSLPVPGLHLYALHEVAILLGFHCSPCHQPVVALGGQRGLDITRNQLDISMEKEVYCESNVIWLANGAIYFSNPKSILRLVSYNFYLPVLNIQGPRSRERVIPSCSP